MKSREVRRLHSSWQQNRHNWPQFLDWIEVSGLRGWSGQRLALNFPIVALVGENGTGKSTILQAAASLYRPPQDRQGYYASDFFPSTAWEQVSGVQIRGLCRQGQETFERSVRRPTSRWLGNPDRRQRPVSFLDLRRTQPIYARIGYKKIAKSNAVEADAQAFDNARRDRASTILGKSYESAKHAATDLDPARSVPVLSTAGITYSGFHQGAGENAVVDLLAQQAPDTGLVLIDELETSLHPRAQRRIIRDFANLARTSHLQLIITTHSPYILEELPPEARIYIDTDSQGSRTVMIGVSADYAMTFMDDVQHSEVDVYVEDEQARILFQEILYRHARENVRRVQFIEFGAANVGQSLGQMRDQGRFARPSLVVLDGDQDPAPGVHTLPGGDSPERVVFEGLAGVDYQGLQDRTNRQHAAVVDALESAITEPNHHEWVRQAASEIVMGGRDLWRAMCAMWVEHCLDREDVQAILDDLEDALAP